jgi:hypothetical protein
VSAAKRRRFRYDVFVSYSHVDKNWVREWLVPCLKEASLSVCVDYECFKPGSPSIIEMERAALQSRKTVLVLTPGYLRSEWAEFENILVQTADPAGRRQRLVPLLLARCDLPPRLGMLTYSDFTGSGGQSDRLAQLVAAIRRRPGRGRKPDTTTAMSLSFEVPTGALSPDSPIYVERTHDQCLREQVTWGGTTTIIEGARQMGKTSLMARAVAHARSGGCDIVDFNFQAFGEEQLHDLETFLHYLADAIHERLHTSSSPQAVWLGPLGAKDKLTSFLRSQVLQRACRPVVVVMDEVDRVFGRQYQDDFFGLLRSWHDARAFDPLWKKVNLVLAYSTDPRQAIKDLNQSPFNVGVRILLEDFSFDEMWELNGRYDRPVRRKDQVRAIMRIVGGHPCLAQHAFYALATCRSNLNDLLDTNRSDVGPFSDLLQHYRRLLESSPILKQAMREVMTHGRCPDYAVFWQLKSVGLVTGTDHHEARPKCQLYDAYFRRVLR